MFIAFWLVITQIQAAGLAQVNEQFSAQSVCGRVMGGQQREEKAYIKVCGGSPPIICGL